MQLIQQIHNLHRRRRIQRRRRLIRNQNLRPHRKNPRNRHTLPLTARQMMRRPPLIPGKPHRKQRIRHPPMHLLLGKMQIRRTKRHIRIHTRRKHLRIRILEHQPHRSPHPPQRRPIIHNLLPVHTDTAPLRHQRPVTHQKQRRLPGTIRPDHCHLLSAFNRKRNPPQRRRTARIRIPDIIKL